MFIREWLQGYIYEAFVPPLSVSSWRPKEEDMIRGSMTSPFFLEKPHLIASVHDFRLYRNTLIEFDKVSREELRFSVLFFIKYR